MNLEEAYISNIPSYFDLLKQHIFEQSKFQTDLENNVKDFRKSILVKTFPNINFEDLQELSFSCNVLTNPHLSIIKKLLKEEKTEKEEEKKEENCHKYRHKLTNQIYVFNKNTWHIIEPF
jgi:hypothetical protein